MAGNSAEQKQVGKNGILNPERVILNLIQNLLQRGLIQDLTNSNLYETLKQVQGDKIVIATQSLRESYCGRRAFATLNRSM